MMDIRLVLAVYLTVGLITALALKATIKSYDIRPFEEVSKEIALYGSTPERKLELGLAWEKTAFGFLGTVLIWPPMAIALIHDAILAAKKKK
jgi:hypothetical protein